MSGYYSDRDFGDETDFNEWIEKQFEEFDEEDDFYFDPEFWNFDDADEDDDGDEAGALALI